MSEASGKKKKLFQVAKELNLAVETIKDFLEKKGVAVTNPNVRIDEETYDLILKRFSFEKKEAEKIQKRREVRREERIHEAEEVQEPQEEEFAETEPETEEEEIAAEAPEAVEVSEEEPETAGEVAEEQAPEELPAPEAELAEKPVEETPEAVETIEAEAVAEVSDETPAAEEIIEIEEEADEAEIPISPRVGDIIDHPMARQYLERQQREEMLKKERQKRALERLKRKEEPPKKEKKKAARPGEEPVEARAAAATETAEVEEKRRERKKSKKKGQAEVLEEKEARRRKALEMIRRESKRIRPQAVGMDETEEAGVEAPEKEGGRRKRQKKKKEVDQKEVESALKKTLAEMRDTGTGKRKRRRIRAEEGEEEVAANVIKVTEFISTQDLANLLDVPAPEIIRKCLELGLVVTINQRLDMDTIRLLAEEFGFAVQEEEEYGSEYLEGLVDEEDKLEDLATRSPVVTIMGHVDHGKTSLLDYIRHTNVVAGEFGGITQHIGAYEVQVDDNRTITFLDTPGHEAFTAMRARGAQVTDIVVLVIAADDQVMPQTEEALDHAKAAGVRIVIAINKIDKPGANPDGIRKQLAERNILVEEWGGNYQCVEVSAKTGHNVPVLLEKILLEAEVLELKANPNRPARGVVLEAQLDKGKGPLATVLIQTGTLNVGDCFVIGQHWGRVRAMLNERGKRQNNAGPSAPVQVLGIDGVPEAGDRLIVMHDEKSAREIAQRRHQLKREQDFRQVRLMTLDELSRQIKTGDVKELNILVKADVDGSAQALADSLSKLSTEAVEVRIIRRAVGPITESDVILAAASQAIIIGFNVRPTLKAKEMAEQERIDIRLYKVIYDAIEDVEKALEGMLEPVQKEVVTGALEIREVFKISRIGSVAGCYVLNGKINRNSNVRLIRNDVEIYDGKLSSLKRFKDDVREVQAGYECGLTIENFNDIKQGDIVEAYEIVMEAQTLSRPAVK
ncbi:MAG: translation initiation factor IF-2 [Calditrichaceae bacterium]|nr:translation initiation factor IF-2 [Calditrichia bacterium]NUQ43268.1 translation initiation factor IF-2 [Calditrichaceae bacterium]